MVNLLDFTFGKKVPYKGGLPYIRIGVTFGVKFTLY
jgi:hypothetical protein